MPPIAPKQPAGTDADGEGTPGRSDGQRRGRKVSEILAREIVEGITANGLQPGDVLPPEADMIKSYGVGRATLREALRLLEAQGVVRVKPGPGGGPVLASLTPRDFGEMAKLHLHIAGATFGEVLQARLAIEPLVARMAAEARDPVLLAELRDVVETADATDINDGPAYAEESRSFHATVARASGNRVLDLLAEGLKVVYDTRVRGALMPKHQRPVVRQVHREILEAIEEGRGTDAERLMRDHLVRFANEWKKQNPRLYDDTVVWD